MKQLLIKKGKPLNGEIYVSGSKNSALPILAATLLSKKNCYLRNIPNLVDIQSMLKLLESLGVSVSKKKSKIILNASKLNSYRADYNLVRKMRASILVLGPLLARFRKAKVSLPGGCAIGNRPIDLHLFGMKNLGAKISIENGYVVAEAPKGLIANRIELPSKSVGASENIILAAVLAKGRSTIINVAREPEIEDLCNYLNSMGAKIKGVGTSRIEVQGTEILSTTNYSIIPDRIEAGTFLISALITRGKLKINNAIANHLTSPINILKKMGAKCTVRKKYIIVNGKKSFLKPAHIKTGPYPAFPTDLQAQFMSLLAIVNGNSSIQENVFKNRFMHVSELNRLGAIINVKKNKSIIKGVNKLIGAPIMANDLRASVSLVLAGLVAEGETKISRIYHLDRGYEKIENKLNNCGAKIKRIG